MIHPAYIPRIPDLAPIGRCPQRTKPSSDLTFWVGPSGIFPANLTVFRPHGRKATVRRTAALAGGTGNPATPNSQICMGKLWWRVLGSNQRRLSRRFYRPPGRKRWRSLIHWARHLWRDLETRSDPAYIPRLRDVATAGRAPIIECHFRVPRSAGTAADDLHANALTNAAWAVPATGSPPCRQDA
jgi:hypothetical protein